jgi:hypothetical protein
MGLLRFSLLTTAKPMFTRDLSLGGMVGLGGTVECCVGAPNSLAPETDGYGYSTPRSLSDASVTPKPLHGIFPPATDCSSLQATF